MSWRKRSLNADAFRWLVALLRSQEYPEPSRELDLAIGFAFDSWRYEDGILIDGDGKPTTEHEWLNFTENLSLIETLVMNFFPHEGWNVENCAYYDGPIFCASVSDMQPTSELNSNQLFNYSTIALLSAFVDAIDFGAWRSNNGF